LFVLAVTNDFLGSDYIFDHELPAIIERHRIANALVVPILIRPSGWKMFFGGYIQALPGDGTGGIKPVLTWHRTEDGFAAAAAGVAVAVQAWFGVTPKTPFNALKGKIVS